MLASGELLRVSDVAKSLGISEAKVYQLTSKGDLRHVRIGRVLRIPSDAVAEFLDRVTVGGVR